MKIRPWLAGAAGVAAVTLGFGTGASAAVHHTAHVWRAPMAFGHLAARPGVTPATSFFGNWAGYVAFAHKNVSLRYVNADFNVPSLNCTNAGANATVIQLVGLQDWNLSGEVIGVEGQCSSTSTYTYQAGYNIGTSGGGTSTATINPGDAMVANVYYNTTTKKYTFYLNDVTSQTVIFNVTVGCPSGSSCSTTTAEAITDDAFDASTSTILPVADYGMENFTNGAVTSADGVRGGFGSSKLWTSGETTMRPNSTVLASPSSLEGGSAYSTTWHAQS